MRYDPKAPQVAASSAGRRIVKKEEARAALQLTANSTSDRVPAEIKPVSS